MFRFEPAETVSAVFHDGKPPVPRDELRMIGAGAEDDWTNQFSIFQFGSDVDGPTLIEPSQVKPSLEGSDAAPDVQAAIELMSFHLGKDEVKVDKDARATMRITFGKDQLSKDEKFDAAFWAIAAGLKLYNAAESGQTDASDLSFGSKEAFGNRPIDIPGGLGTLSFEVTQHKEPPWYRRIFRFLQSDTGKGLVSVLGFPQLAVSAVRAIDQFLDRFDDEDPIFSSRPLRLALSARSRDELQAGNPNVHVGVLSKGYNVFARLKDFSRFNDQPLDYLPHLNRLVPRGISQHDLTMGNFEDPLEDVTYAVCGIGLRETELDAKFDFEA